MVDLDDTSKCPERESCEACGGDEDLVPITLDSPVGIFCAVVCDPCIDGKRFPKLSWVQAAERAYQHADHLGISIDEAAELQQPSGDSGLTL
jgi:hypothetical protein